MKITLISGNKANWNSGASTVYLHLDRELQRQGYSCRLFNLEDYHNPIVPAALARLTDAHFLKRRLLKHAQHSDIVEIVGGLGWPLFRALRTRSAGQRPVLITRLHGLEFKDEQVRIDEEIARQVRLPWKYKAINRHLINYQEFKSISLADIVICHSSREADALVTAGIKAERDVFCLPLGVDPEFFSQERREYGGGRLLWWGSWIERKGVSAMPRAFELACREDDSLTLTIGGTGLPENEILTRFPSHLKPRITVLPFVTRERHIEILGEHDIFLFPSLSEGFGLALLEAMATGMPCITTFTGLAYDRLKHNQDCLLVPMSGPTALAREVVRLSSDKALQRRLGENAKEAARPLTWEHFAQESAGIYERALCRAKEHAIKGDNRA